MRKVKFTQSTFHEKLSAIVDSFPKLDDSASRSPPPAAARRQAPR